MKSIKTFYIIKKSAEAVKIGFLIFILLLVNSCEKKDNDLNPLTEGAAPLFTLNSLDGSQVSLTDYNNKVIVLFFFGSSCPSCKAAAPDFQSMLVTPFAARNDYQVLGLDQWNGNQAAVQAFKSSTGVSFPLLLNASPVAAEYKTTYDRLVVIDKNGDIVFSGSQGIAADIATVKGIVESELGPLTADPPTEPVVKGNAPYFSLNSLAGSVIKLSDFNGKVVVLFFFGYNCSSCKGIAPNVESMLVTSFASRSDYQLLGLDQWNGNQAAVQAFKTTTSVTFPLLLNASEVAADYKTTYDRFVVIDKNGDIAFMGTQLAAQDLELVKQKVGELLAK